MNWLFLVAFGIFVGWVLWRGYEAYSFRKVIASFGPEITDESVQSFMAVLAVRPVPNARSFWDQLKTVENRVMEAPRVSEKVKAELRTMLQSKGIQF